MKEGEAKKRRSDKFLTCFSAASEVQNVQLGVGNVKTGVDIPVHVVGVGREDGQEEEQEGGRRRRRSRTSKEKLNLSCRYFLACSPLQQSIRPLSR